MAMTVAPDTAGYAAAAPDPSVVPQGDITRLMRMFSESQTTTEAANRLSLRDSGYYHGDQLTSDEKATLAQRKQPIIIINRVRAAVNGMLGVVGKAKSEPRAYGRNPADGDAADVVTDTLRFIADDNRLPRLKQACFLDALTRGTMAAMPIVGDDKRIVVEQIRWENFFYDPYSRREDFADARFMGVAKWVYADDVEVLYPEFSAQIRATVDNASVGTGTGSFGMFADRPAGSLGTLAWVDGRRRRLQLVEMYYRERGEWLRAVFIANCMLEQGKSPWNDHKGRATCPIVARSCYVDDDNQRYGPVRDMIGTQDEINKRRSKALHWLSVRQLEAADLTVIDTDKDVARAEAARPDGVLPPGYKIAGTNDDMMRGQFEFLAEAKSEMERLGPNPAVLGRGGEDSSGRALLARQQAGMVELDILFAQLEDWEVEVYRQCWARVKQFWREPQFIRVTDDLGAPRYIGLNQPKGQQVPHVGPDGQPVMDEQGQQAMKEMPPSFFPGQAWNGMPHPQAGQSVFGYKNNVAEMDVDIIIDVQPWSATVQAEQYQDLMQLVSASPLYQQQVPLYTLLSLSTIPHKRELLEQLKGEHEQQQQAMAAQAQQQQQIAQATAAANIRKIESETARNTATAEGTLAKAHTDAYKAGADVASSAQGAADANAQHAAEMAAQQAAAGPSSGDTGGPSA